MRSIPSITQETILLLRRDYVFLPLIFLTIGIVWFAKTASDWSIMEGHKFIFDISYAAIHISGTFAAIYWSTKIFSDSRSDGSIELLVASPVSRTSILIGRYLGMAFVLILYGAVSALILQITTKLFIGFEWFAIQELLTFVYFIEGWLVIAAVGTMFAALANQTTAFFSTFLMWLIGMTSSGFAFALTEEQSPVARQFVEFVARVWNLQTFNLSGYVGMDIFVSERELWWRFGYGVTILVMALTVAVLSFRSKDAVA